MNSALRRSRVFRALLGTAVVAALCAMGGAGNAKPAPPPSDPPAVPVQEPPPAAAAAEQPADQTEAPPPRPQYGPADGKWLVDEEGREYYVEKIPKGVEGASFIWVGENRIRVYGGLEFDVLDQDETTFSIKILKPKVPAPMPARERTTAEDLEKAAATYRSDLPAVDRLRLETFDRGLPKAGQWRHGFAVGDMNGDGHLDLVHGPSRKGAARPHVFLGDGEGTWQLWRDASYPPFPYDYGDVGVADFNGDGHQDIGLAMHMRGMVALIGDGEGHFQLWSEGIEVDLPDKKGDEEAFSSRALSVVDWNGDQRPDLLALGEGFKRGPMAGTRGPEPTGVGYRVSARGALVYLNNGDGTWTREIGPPAPYVFGDHLAVGNFNGDERPDFVAASGAISYRHILNLGTEDGAWEQVEIAALRPGSFQRSVAAARIDGDPLDDLVVGYINSDLGVWRTGMDVLLNRGENGWERQTLRAMDGKTSIGAVAAGDLDGDGRTDVAGVTGHGEIWLFLGDGAGSFGAETSPELPAAVGGCAGYSLRLVDLNGDGRDELVVGFAGEGSVNPVYEIPGCPQKGSLRAWTAVPADSQ